MYVLGTSSRGSGIHSSPHIYPFLTFILSKTRQVCGNLWAGPRYGNLGSPCTSTCPYILQLPIFPVLLGAWVGFLVCYNCSWFEIEGKKESFPFISFLLHRNLSTDSRRFDFDTHNQMHSKLKKVLITLISTAFHCLLSSWYWQKANSVAAAENTVLYK